jgi:hypothetical protein
MNQYIFRGKRKDGQGWVEGDLVRYWAYGVLYTCIVDAPTIDELSDLSDYKVDPKTVGLMLFKVGNAKAFEGDYASFDVAAFGEDMPEIKNQKGVIAWVNGCATIGGWNLQHCRNIKLVDNIHDNPELLQKE